MFKPQPVKVGIPHKDKISSFMLEFIEKVVDVAGDIHCGFRAVADLHNMSVDDYHIIRYELLKELTVVDSDRYLRLIGPVKRFNEVKHALTSDGISPTPPDKWMIMSDMSFLIAKRYKQVVVLLSVNKGQSETYFPLRGAPSHRNRIMCLAHVNDNYFMMVKLKDGCTIPLTYVLWARHCRDDAKTWDVRYVDRMVSYNGLRRAAGYEVIGDDDL